MNLSAVERGVYEHIVFFSKNGEHHRSRSQLASETKGLYTDLIQILLRLQTLGAIREGYDCFTISRPMQGNASRKQLDYIKHLLDKLQMKEDLPEDRSTANEMIRRLMELEKQKANEKTQPRIVKPEPPRILPRTKEKPQRIDAATASNAVFSILQGLENE